LGIPPRRRVSESEIRQRFAAGGFAARIESGLLREVVVKDRAYPLATEPPGTRSQMVAYFDGRQRVALVHRYLRPDGSVGASGMPDPKELFDDGILYFV
jgi:hypothetical protein